MQKTLMTGANGFVGAALRERLERGANPCRCGDSDGANALSAAGRLPARPRH